MESIVLGVDIGGTGIKAAVVDTVTGELLTDRVKMLTPKPATPEAVAAVVAELAKQLDYKGNLIGVGFPAIIKDGIALSAANIDKSWINTNIEKVIGEATGKKVIGVNDADAAGLAEMRFGVGKGRKGTVMLITIGTGLGSALFIDGILVPNTELGHVLLEGKGAELYASNTARKNFKLSWTKWGKRFNKYLSHLEFLFSPHLFILGGGASKKFDEFQEEITVKAEVKPAELLNAAGCIGAACYAVYKTN